MFLKDESQGNAKKKKARFSLPAIKFLLFHFNKFNYDVPWHEFLWTYPIWAHLALWVCRFMCFAKYEMFSVIISPSTLSAHSPSPTGHQRYIIQRLMFWYCSTDPRGFLFGEGESVFSLFSLFCSDRMDYIVLSSGSLIFYPLSLILLLSTSSGLF